MTTPLRFNEDSRSLGQIEWRRLYTAFNDIGDDLAAMVDAVRRLPDEPSTRRAKEALDKLKSGPGTLHLLHDALVYVARTQGTELP